MLSRENCATSNGRSWRKRQAQLPSPKFWAVIKFSFLSQNVCPKMLNLGLKTSIWGKFKDKIKILSTHKNLYRKYGMSVGQLKLQDVPKTHDATDGHSSSSKITSEIPKQ